MRNPTIHWPAFPQASTDNGQDPGLSKLEYAAVHLVGAYLALGYSRGAAIEHGTETAQQLLDHLGTGT